MQHSLRTPAARAAKAATPAGALAFSRLILPANDAHANKSIETQTTKTATLPETATNHKHKPK